LTPTARRERHNSNIIAVSGRRPRERRNPSQNARAFTPSSKVIPEVAIPDETYDCTLVEMLREAKKTRVTGFEPRLQSVSDRGRKARELIIELPEDSPRDPERV